MITVISTTKNSKDNPQITFKLTPPSVDAGDGDIVEEIPERLVKLGLGGHVFRSLGYRWMGGNMDTKTMYYKPKDPEMFTVEKELYIELTLDKDKKRVTHSRKLTPNMPPSGSAVEVEVLAIPEVTHEDTAHDDGSDSPE